MEANEGGGASEVERYELCEEGLLGERRVPHLDIRGVVRNPTLQEIMKLPGRERKYAGGGASNSPTCPRTGRTTCTLSVAVFSIFELE